MRQRSWWVGCTVLVAACSGGDGKDGAAGADGKNGLNALVATSVVEPGDDCVAGGYQVRSGQDLDDDGKLSAEETRSTDYVCNGVPGTPGRPGSGSGGAADGSNGSNGADGADGADGAVSLVTVTTLAPGDDCSAGGLRLEAGLDLDGNGSLEAAEVTTTRALCNGVPGSAADKGDPGIDSLVVTHPEDKGNNCTNGGIRIDIGQDADRDATLSQAEIATTSYVCNGADGAPGMTGPKGDDGAPGTTGPKGDDGANGNDGTDGTNGTNGLGTLVVTANEPPGKHCTFGGTVVTTGLDDGTPTGTAGDGVLDPGEVNAAATTYLCRPELSLEDLLETAGEVISLHLESASVSKDFVVVHDLGSESDVTVQINKDGTKSAAPGPNSFFPATLQGRFAGKELEELVAWRKQFEVPNKAGAKMMLTATDLATKKEIAAWQLTNAWPQSLEVEELASGGDPVVTVKLVYDDLVRGKSAGPVVTNAVRLVTGNNVDTTCATVSGIGSSSGIVNSKGKLPSHSGPVISSSPVCVRSLDADLDITNWRTLAITNNQPLAKMTLTLPDKSGFDYTNSWPSKLTVDTGPDGTLIETATIVSDLYEQK